MFNNRFIVEVKCPYCGYHKWLLPGLTNPDKLVQCDDCTYNYPLHNHTKEYEILAKYYLQ